MRQIDLGRTGIKVSELCLGTMTWGTQNSEAEGHAQMDMALSQGVNFWDTAEMYPVNPVSKETAGRTESIIGTWFAARGGRARVVLATKIAGGGQNAVRDGIPPSATVLRQAVEGSLRRLQTDWIDLYQIHWPARKHYHFRDNWAYDPRANDAAQTEALMLDVLQEVGKLVAEGKIRALALSNETVWGAAKWLALAEKHDFVIFADECYCEIWRTAPPPGILDVAAQVGADPERVFSFHSLSKRSNLPGLRSGFVAGGAKGITQIRKLRAFAGAPVPLPVQRVSEAAWRDEAHVIANQALYREKFTAAEAIFSGLQGFAMPEGGFFLWLPVEDGEAAALNLWRDTGVRVLPGAYLSRDAMGVNPGTNYIRVALVAPKEEMQQGLIRLRDCLYG